jgi:hypothetical protein
MVYDHRTDKSKVLEKEYRRREGDEGAKGIKKFAEYFHFEFKHFYSYFDGLGRGADHHPLLVPGSRKDRAITSIHPLGLFRPVMGLMYFFFLLYDIPCIRAGRPRDRIPVGARFFAHIQTDPVQWSFPGVKRPGRGADYPPPPIAQGEKFYSDNTKPPGGRCGR